MLLSKDSCCKKEAFKYFTGYVTIEGIKSYCIKLPQMNRWRTAKKNTIRYGIRLGIY